MFDSISGGGLEEAPYFTISLLPEEEYHQSEAIEDGELEASHLPSLGLSLSLEGIP